MVQDPLLAQHLFGWDTRKDGVTVVEARDDSLTFAFLDRDGRTDAFLLSSTNDARQRLLLSCCIENTWSKCTPRYLTEDLKQCFRQCLLSHHPSTQDANKIQQKWPLFCLCFNLLCFIYERVSSIHVWTLFLADGWALSHNSVSSAH